VVALTSNAANIRTHLPEADLLINAAVWPPKADTHLVTREMLSLMKRGAVIVDITADEAAAIETTTKKTHSQPTYMVDGILHYCVPNIPGVVPKTSTPALSNATLPYVLEITNKGIRRALDENRAILRGLCFIDGKVTHRATATAQGLEYCPPELL
jgi:alanine dehydrogenase